MSSLVLSFVLLLALLLPMPARADTGDVARGAYLAKLGDCAACHTAPHHPDFAGGLPINAPVGTIYSTNITPDFEDGIGKYSLEDFDHAVRKGIDKEGERLYPAMPYASYSFMSDQDIKDLYAYFMKSVRPVHYTPTETRLPFPFNQRWGLMFWDWVFEPHRDFKPDVGKSAQWNRGAYLVRSLGHCGACHTPRNLAYAERGYSERSRAFLTGGILDNWFAADLRRLGSWSVEDIVTFLKTGFGRGSTAFGSMKQVVEDSTQYMSDADLASIATYLKSISLEEKQSAAGTAGLVQWPGAGLYHSACASCHQASGEGLDRKYPQLAESVIITSDDPLSLIRIVLQGGRPAQTAANPHPAAMPAFSGKLSDREIAEVLSYIRNSWGNKAKPVSPRDVRLLRKTLHLEPFPSRDDKDADGAHHGSREP